MKIKLREVEQVLKLVFGNPKYLLFGLITFILIFSFNLLINNWQVLSYSLMNEPSRLFVLIPSLMFGALNSMIWHGKITLVLISVLTALVIPLIIFKIKLRATELKGRSDIGFIGVSLGLFTSGCASCGIGLAAALGLSGTLGALPFAGLEIAIVGILLLSLSLYWLIDSIYNCESCKVLLK